MDKNIAILIGGPTLAGDVNPELRLGTLCTDQSNKWYNKTLEVLRPAIEHFEEVSIIGEIISKSMLDPWAATQKLSFSSLETPMIPFHQR